MNLAQLRAFEAVVDTGGFTAAARALGKSQSTVSELVAALERDHGVVLVERRPSGASPTALGREVHAQLARLLRLADDLERVMSPAHLPALRLGADAPVHAISLIARWREISPGARVVVSGGNSRDLIDLLRRDALDAVIVADVPDSPDLVSRVIRRQSLVALLPTAHRVPHHVTAHELLASGLVMREEGSATRDAVTAHAASLGIAVRETATADSREAVTALVVAGYGWGVIAEDEIVDDPRVAAVDIVSPAIVVTEHLVMRPGTARSTIGRTLLACVERPS